MSTAAAAIAETWAGEARHVVQARIVHVDAQPLGDWATEWLRSDLVEHGWEGARATLRKVAHTLRFAGYTAYANRVESCFAHGTIEDVVADGQDGAVEAMRETTLFHPDDECGLSKLCPFHARKKAKERVDKFVPYIEDSARQYRLQLVTLTVPNVAVGSLKQAVDGIWHAFENLRRTDLWSKAVAGSLATLEVTWGREEGWHPHVHVLAAVRYGVDFPWGDVRERWARATGAQVVDFREVRPGKDGSMRNAVEEVLKYVSAFKAGHTQDGREKPGMADWPPYVLAEFVETFVVTKAKTHRAFGIWYKLPKKPDVPKVERGRVVARWRWTFDEQGKLRLRRLDADGGPVDLIHDPNSASGPGQSRGNSP